MWKKMTAVDTYDNQADLWLNDQVKVLGVKALGSGVALLLLEGGMEVRVAGSPEDIAKEMAAMVAARVQDETDLTDPTGPDAEQPGPVP